MTMDTTTTLVPSRADGERIRGAIVTAIDVLTKAQHRPPTNREIGAYVGAKSSGHIFHHLQILVAQGRVRRVSGMSRCYVISQSAREALSVPDDAGPEIVQLVDTAIALETRLREWSSAFSAAGRETQATLLTILSEAAGLVVSGLTTLPDITELP